MTLPCIYASKGFYISHSRTASATHPPPYDSVAAMDEMLTMCPLLRSIMPSTKAFVKAMTAVTLVSIMVATSWAGARRGGEGRRLRGKGRTASRMQFNRSNQYYRGGKGEGSSGGVGKSRSRCKSVTEGSNKDVGVG